MDLEKIYSYEYGEVWDLRASPYDRQVLACSSQEASDGRSVVQVVSMEIGDEEGEQVDEERRGRRM